MWIILMVSIFLLLLFLGFPILLALLIPSLIYTVYTGAALSSLILNLIFGMNKWPLVAIPLFILLGAMANELGTTDKIFNLARAIFRNKVGYSLRANVLISLIFAGISGSMLADIGGLGLIEVEAAEKEGFQKPYACAVTIATSIIGPTFPPSIPLIIYAFVAQVSAVRALIAGIFPALLIAAFLYAYVAYSVPKKLSKSKQDLQKISQQPPKFLTAFVDAIPILLLPPFIIYSMMAGLFSPTEAAAGAVGFMVLVCLYYRTLNLRNLSRAIIQTLKSTVSIMSIVAAGQVFTNILVVEGLADIVTETLLSVSRNPLVILLVVNLVLLIVGMLMEGLTILLLVTPILVPLGKMLGIDPIHLGIVLTLNINIGLLTPPFGMGLFTVSSVTNTPMSPIIRESWPWIIILILALLVLTFFPIISTWLPNLVFGKG